MGQELISKKELLETYGISYGTLYRWQRTGLIPKEWFIRRSTETGQETYFPRDLITERVNYIILGKDTASLEELAAVVNGKAEEEMILVIETGYGVEKIPLEQIKNITITGGGKSLGIDEIVNILKDQKVR